MDFALLCDPMSCWLFAVWSFFFVHVVCIYDFFDWILAVLHYLSTPQIKDPKSDHSISHARKHDFSKDDRLAPLSSDHTPKFATYIHTNAGKFEMYHQLKSYHLPSFRSPASISALICCITGSFASINSCQIFLHNQSMYLLSLMFSCFDIVFFHKKINLCALKFELDFASLVYSWSSFCIDDHWLLVYQILVDMLL